MQGRVSGGAVIKLAPVALTRDTEAAPARKRQTA